MHGPCSYGSSRMHDGSTLIGTVCLVRYHTVDPSIGIPIVADQLVCWPMPHCSIVVVCGFGAMHTMGRGHLSPGGTLPCVQLVAAAKSLPMAVGPKQATMMHRSVAPCVLMPRSGLFYCSTHAWDRGHGPQAAMCGMILLTLPAHWHQCNVLALQPSAMAAAEALTSMHTCSHCLATYH
jgi:hypothetical protein